jgi:methyl-accepting chemotaxis protein
MGNERGSAEILVDAIRETSSSMREVALDLRDVVNSSGLQSKAVDELRTEIRRQADIMLRIENFLKELADERAKREGQTTALAKFADAALKSPAVQFALTALAFWLAAKLGVLQYLGVTDAP